MPASVSDPQERLVMIAGTLSQATPAEAMMTSVRQTAVHGTATQRRVWNFEKWDLTVSQSLANHGNPRPRLELVLEIMYFIRQNHDSSCFRPIK